MREIRALICGLAVVSALAIGSSAAVGAESAPAGLVNSSLVGVVTTQDDGVSSEDVVAAFIGFLGGATVAGGASAAAIRRQGKKSEAGRDRRADLQVARESVAECLGAIRELQFTRGLGVQGDVSSTITSAARSSARFQAAASTLGLDPGLARQFNKALPQALSVAMGGPGELDEEFEDVVERILRLLDLGEKMTA